MTDNARDLIKDQLPDLASGNLDPVRADEIRHAIAEDPELRREFDLILALHEGRPRPPLGLADRIRAGVTEEAPRQKRWIGWPLSTAAVLVIALGTALFWNGEGGTPAGVPPLDDPEAPSVFPADDGLVAGALLLADLSDEEIEALLEEIGQ
ncbi:MAG: hypothetical protein ACR2QM_21105 [Longimicrobiales bacterium]